MRPVLAIWTARQIPLAQYHLRHLRGIDKLWIHGHTEWELADALPAFLESHPEYTHAILIPDDTLVSQAALDSLTQTIHRYPLDTAISGWSNCDYTHTYTNVSLHTLTDPAPTGVNSYGRFLEISDLASRHEPIQVTFAGHSLFSLPRHLWLHADTRLHPCGPRRENGYASDYNQCRRLDLADIPIHVDPLAFIPHLKLNHLGSDTRGWKQLDLANKRVLLEVLA